MGLHQLSHSLMPNNPSGSNGAQQPSTPSVHVSLQGSATRPSLTTHSNGPNDPSGSNGAQQFVLSTPIPRQNPGVATTTTITLPQTSANAGVATAQAIAQVPPPMTGINAVGKAYETIRRALGQMPGNISLNADYDCVYYSLGEVPASNIAYCFVYTQWFTFDYFKGLQDLLLRSPFSLFMWGGSRRLQGQTMFPSTVNSRDRDSCWIGFHFAKGPQWPHPAAASVDTMDNAWNIAYNEARTTPVGSMPNTVYMKWYFLAPGQQC